MTDDGAESPPGRGAAPAGSTAAGAAGAEGGYLHLAAWRLALSGDDATAILARPDDAVRAGHRGLIRLVTLGGVMLFLFAALFVFPGWLDSLAAGPFSRFIIMVALTGLVDAIFFHDIRGASPRAVRIELQDDCLKWTEGIEIGQIPWADVRAIALADVGEPAERRLVVADRFGRRLLFRGTAPELATLMARLARERPDLEATDLTREVAGSRGEGESRPADVSLSGDASG